MKKSRKVLMLSLMFLLIFAGTSLAAKSEVGVKIDGKALSEKGILEKGRTFVPVRAIFESGDANVSWDNKRKAAIIELGKDKIILNTKGDTSYYNGVEIYLPSHDNSSVKLVNGRVYLPLRLMGYLMNYEVEWDSKGKTANLDKLNYDAITLQEAHDILRYSMGDDAKYIYSPLNNYGSDSKELSDNFFIFMIVDWEYGDIDDSNFGVNKLSGDIYTISPSY